MKIFDKFFTKKTVVEEISDESGAGTAFALTFAFVCIGIGGLSIDAANVWATKQRLQAATDVAAHATAVDMVWPGFSGYEGTPDQVAIAAIQQNMPASKYGISVQPSDVHLAYWNEDTKELTNSAMTAGGDERLRAVAVTARLDGEVGNVVPTFILKLVGFDYWKTATSAVFVQDVPCPEGGFIANGTFNIETNARFDQYICLHGNGVNTQRGLAVDAQSHVYFGEGVRITMPNSAFEEDGGMFNLDGTDHTFVEGIETQVGDGYVSTGIATIPSLAASFQDLADPYDPSQPDYITNMTVNHITVHANALLVAEDLVANAVNIIDCPNPGMSFPDDMDILNMVIIADCKINFGNNGVVSNAIIATTDTSNQSLNSASNMQFGADDNCTPGGGVTLMTMGEAHFASGSEWYGTEMIANGDIHISAQASGIEGISFISNGDIHATSNLGFGNCVGAVDAYKELLFIRMVR